MERDRYLTMCQRTSIKVGYKGAWWAVKWDKSDLVAWDGRLYIPVDYQFGFRAGAVTGVAVLHDLNTSSVVYAKLDKVSEVQQ